MSDIHIDIIEHQIDPEDVAAVAEYIEVYMKTDEYKIEHMNQEKKVLKDNPIDSK
tara:strand:+ start:54 stop:218 length:165 start_codon:yes stop_codon:yes gene_type:complete